MTTPNAPGHDPLSTRAIVLMAPGLWNSNPDHWQSLWEAEVPTWKRIQQADWERPLRADWVSTIDAAIRAERAPAVLVAHCLGCVAVAHWAELGHLVRGALLVAPADVEGWVGGQAAAPFWRLLVE